MLSFYNDLNNIIGDGTTQTITNEISSLIRLDIDANSGDVTIDCIRIYFNRNNIIW